MAVTVMLISWVLFRLNPEKLPQYPIEPLSRKFLLETNQRQIEQHNKERAATLRAKALLEEKVRLHSGMFNLYK